MGLPSTNRSSNLISMTGRHKQFEEDAWNYPPLATSRNTLTYERNSFISSNSVPIISFDKNPLNLNVPDEFDSGYEVETKNGVKFNVEVQSFLLKNNDADQVALRDFLVKLCNAPIKEIGVYYPDRQQYEFVDDVEWGGYDTTTDTGRVLVRVVKAADVKLDKKQKKNYTRVIMSFRSAYKFDNESLRTISA